MKKDTYITIQSWMRNELNLKGNELLVYALIFGFCQDGETKFTGSLNYIAEWIGTAKSTVQLTLLKLIDGAFIEKHETIRNSIKFCEYSIIERCTENRYGGVPKIGTGGIPKIGTNNNNIYNNNWKNDFNVYKTQLRDVYNQLIIDTEYIEQQEKYHPGVDIQLTIEKACVNFWATEAGWKHKKSQRSIEINWKSTLTKAISQSINKVYKSRK